MNFLDLQTIWTPRLLSVLRIVAALLFLEHGTQKLLGFPPSPNPGPTLLSIFGLAGLLELIGGALLAAGLFTRPVAFILSGEMAVAYWTAHAPRSFFPRARLAPQNRIDGCDTPPEPIASCDRARQSATKAADLGGQ